MSTQLCDYCHQKPRFSNYLYCGRTCASQAAQSLSSPPAPSGLCNHCHSKPKFQNFDYCGKTCAANHKLQKPSVAQGSGGGISTSGNCDVCHIKPKWNDGTKVHPFCGKTCANVSKASKGGGHSTTSHAKTPGICCAPGCQKAVFVNSNGSLSDYRSKSHKT